MTATELQSIARMLSNSCWCRHWLNLHSSRTSVIMAIQCRDYYGKPELINDMERRGFRRGDTDALPCLYVIDRTNEDGTPFVSELF